MAQQQIITTPANTGTGDSPKAAFDKINAMFTELYGNGSGGITFGSVVVGAPTGGNQGPGSINAVTLFENGLPVPVTQAAIGAILYPPITAEGATVVNDWYPYGNINRYGTNTTPGTTDMSTALTNALASNKAIYFPAGTYFFSQLAPFSLSGGQTVYGDGPSSQLQFLYGAGNNLQANAVGSVTVKDLAIQITASSGINTYIGAVAFTNVSSYCRALRLSISGVWGCGVYVGMSNNCLVQNCIFNAFQGTNSDQADVYIGQLSGTGGSSYNIVEGNQCFGGGWHGVMIETQNAAGTGVNTYNLVTNNRIGQHVAYGIANYSGAATVDNFTQIIGNYIENIQGQVLSGQAGAGIYSVSAGGNVISNNTIRNCCVQTTSQSLAPGGIGIAQVNVAGLTPVVVSGNNISGMTKFFGIYVTLCTAGVTVTGNSILHPSGNTTGAAIQFQSCSNYTASANTINNLSSQAAFNSNSLANISNININGNIIQSGGVGVLFTSSASFTQSNVVCANNQISISAVNYGINASFLSGANITGNNVLVSAANSATAWSTCAQTRLSNNSFVTTAGAYSMVTGGVSTGSLADVSNYLSASGNQGLNSVSNGATGFNIRSTATSAPSAAGSTQVLGDVAYNIAGVTPFAWACTTAGSPGTFTGLTLP